MTIQKAKVLSTTLKQRQIIVGQSLPLGASVKLADGREAMIAMHALCGASDLERLDRLKWLRPGDELDVEPCFSIEFEKQPLLGAAELGSVYLTQKTQAERWMNNKTVLSGIVKGTSRAYCFILDLPEGMSGRLQFCDVRGASKGDRRDRTSAIRVGEKIRVRVSSVHAWPTCVDIYLQELAV